LLDVSPHITLGEPHGLQCSLVKSSIDCSELHGMLDPPTDPKKAKNRNRWASLSRWKKK
jgi:hypothetical protein